MDVRTTRVLGVGLLLAALAALVVLLVEQVRPRWEGFADSVSAVRVEADGSTLLVTYGYGLCVDRTRVVARESDTQVRLGTQTQGRRDSCEQPLLTGQQRVELERPVGDRRVLAGSRVLYPVG